MESHIVCIFCYLRITRVINFYFCETIENMRSKFLKINVHMCTY